MMKARKHAKVIITLRKTDIVKLALKIASIVKTTKAVPCANMDTHITQPPINANAEAVSS